jgi:hypothetical protein
MSKHRHTRHSHTNGNRRHTTTQSSNGRVTQSSSLKTGNVRVTQTSDNQGHSYTTITTRYGDGSYSTQRLEKHSKPKRNPAEPLPMYSWEWDRDPSERRSSGSLFWDYLIVWILFAIFGGILGLHLLSALLSVLFG